jgi:medium-chain acyl-[acyl-carrier-protein] hydrolase
MSTTRTLRMNKSGQAYYSGLERFLKDSAFPLFCFPYAGGGSRIFAGWQELLRGGIKVCPVELPGRGHRWNEALLPSMSSLVEDLRVGLRPYLTRRFAFFGHSMGALLAFELARSLRRNDGREPDHLFVAGAKAPQVKDREIEIHKLPDKEFLDRLLELEGTEAEIFSKPDLLELLIPIVRSDFECVETYSYRDETPLSCPVSAYGGLMDGSCPQQDQRQWQSVTTGTFALRMFPGNHFFVLGSRAELLEAISIELLRHS